MYYVSAYCYCFDSQHNSRLLFDVSIEWRIPVNIYSYLDTRKVPVPVMVQGLIHFKEDIGNEETNDNC